MMKRITISLDEETYLKVLDYALKRSKAEMRSVSASEAIRELLEKQMPGEGNGDGGSVQHHRTPATPPASPDGEK